MFLGKFKLTSSFLIGSFSAVTCLSFSLYHCDRSVSFSLNWCGVDVESRPVRLLLAAIHGYVIMYIPLRDFVLRRFLIQGECYSVGKLQRSANIIK